MPVWGGGPGIVVSAKGPRDAAPPAVGDQILLRVAPTKIGSTWSDVRAKIPFQDGRWAHAVVIQHLEHRRLGNQFKVRLMTDYPGHEEIVNVEDMPLRVKPLPGTPSVAAAKRVNGPDAATPAPVAAKPVATKLVATKPVATKPAAAKPAAKHLAGGKRPAPPSSEAAAKKPAVAAAMPAFGRKAFVVGFNHYSAATSGGVLKPLKSAVNDATAIAELLQNASFEVTLLTDEKNRQVNKHIFEDKLNAFTRSLIRGDLALFFFAGHGGTYNNRNYLMPSGENLKDELNYESRAMCADRVLGQMQAAGSKFQILLLDCCREWVGLRSVRAGSAVSGGMAEMTAPSGSIIAFATSPNSVSEEERKEKGHGYFTKHLLQHICKPGEEIRNALNNAGLGVMQDTNEKQVPWISGTPMVRGACLVPAA